MNEETKVIKPKAIKPKVRPAEIEDFDKVYPLLKEINSKRLTRDDWFRLFQNHWSIEEFSPGIVLEAGDEIVGYLGTIYSKQMLAGKPCLFCNLTSWIVQDEYRSHSIMMIFPILRNKKFRDRNLILTSFSSNDVTYNVYKKLGFKDGNANKRIVYPFPFFNKLSFSKEVSKEYQIIIDSKKIDENINSETKALFDDHKSFGNIYTLIKYQGKQCLLMGVKRNKLFKLYYVSDKLFFQTHLKYFRTALMKMLQANKMRVDEQLLNDAPLFLSRKVTRGNPYQYKSKMDILNTLSPEYSEIFLLNM